MYENAFNSIERDLRAEEGISNELDYVEQTSWVLFLKYLHDLENERHDRTVLEGKDYSPIIEGEFRWDKWAAPKVNGQFDHNAALTGDDLVDFVDDELFPYLARFHDRATGPDTIEYKIGEVFTELRSKFRSGYILRDVLEIVDGLHFKTQADKHELSALYETRIRRMGNAGRNGGEYYTPRPLIRAMIKVVDPKIGETIYDGAVGSAGFLCEAYDYMRRPNISASDYETLQRRTFYGQEKKSLAYVIGIMNMILHGIEAPNIVHTNSLNENVLDYQEKDRHDIVMANPPFGGGERREVQQNFPIKSGETAYLFLQHFMRKLRAGGRAAVVIKNTFLSNTDNASIALRRELLESCNLHTILDCPQGTFQGAGVKTVVLFFQKGEATRRIWYYQLVPGRSLGKTNPLNDDDMAEFVTLQRGLITGPKSWFVDTTYVDAATFDLSAKNPNAPEAEDLRTPEAVIDTILARDAETVEILERIRGTPVKSGWEVRPLGQVCTVVNGGTPKSNVADYWGGDVNWLTPKDMGQMVGRHIADTPRKITRDGLNNCSARLVPPASVIMSTRAPIGHLAINQTPMAFNQGCRGMVPSTALDPVYLFHFLSANTKALNDLGTGATFKELSASALKAFPIPLPPRDEQRRIVALLDAAFDGLSRARANAEANLADARELFDSFVRYEFQINGSGWPAVTLPKISQNLDSRRIPVTKSERQAGNVPYYGASGVVDQVADHLFDEDLLLVSEDGANLLARTYPIAFSITGKSWVNNHAHVLKFSRGEDQQFVEIYLNAISLEPFVSGMAQPKLNQQALNSIPVPFPDPETRDRFVSKALEVRNNTAHLVAGYQVQLSGLDTLRQALLQKAFSGELHKKEPGLATQETHEETRQAFG